MRKIKDKEGKPHVELSAREARQARIVKPVFYVLIGLIVLSVIVAAAIMAMTG